MPQEIHPEADKSGIFFQGILMRLMLLGLLCLFAGACTAKRYAPDRYQSDPARFGSTNLTTSKTVYLCPGIDRITNDNRRLLEERFAVAAHVTDALQTELATSGITCQRSPLPAVPDFYNIADLLRRRQVSDENSVFIATKILCFAANHWVMDVKVFSSQGEVRFEKRGICFIVGMEKVNDREVAAQTLRQIIADPLFQGAIQ